ncbi:MAG: HAMP domain-containing sensor histidine kinase [Woeseia sp.]
MDALGLRDGAKGMLEAVAMDLESYQSADDQHEKGQGLKEDERTSPLGLTAQAHAAERLAAGFSIDQLVAEYRALRASVVRLWSSSPGFPGRDMVWELTRFSEAIDQSLAESVRWYTNRLERSRAIFIGVLGHDLRNPLGTLMAAVETSQITEDPQVIQECIGRVRRSGSRITEMIDLLLDFSRTHLGEKIPLSLTTVDLSAVCSEVADDFKMSHPDRKITVVSQGITGQWDEARLHQALSNLVKNAIWHGKRDGTITMACKGRAHEVLLSVHNEGRPISPARQSSLFEPFRRPADEDVAATQNLERKNVGLGLYVVNQIALAHGGSVEINSNAEAGTTVTMCLPRQTVA